MNQRIKELMEQAKVTSTAIDPFNKMPYEYTHFSEEKFAELIVSEMCGLMEQAEDDVYHCFEPSERPTEYIEWLRNWQERFEKHFGVEE